LGQTETDLVGQHLQVDVQEACWREQHRGLVVLQWVSLEETELATTINNIVLAPEAGSLAEGEGTAGGDDLVGVMHLTLRASLTSQIQREREMILFETRA